MRASVALVVGVGIVGCLAVVACTTDYQQGKDDVAYGGPNALAGKQPPGTSIDVNADSGASSGSSGGGLSCGTQVDGGACAVSFKTDVIAIFNTANCSNTVCHGTATPVNQPPIDVTNADVTWQNLQKFTVSTGSPYINPCTTDPTASAITENLKANGAVSGGSHMPQSGQVADADLMKIDTWVACGAPDN